MARHLLTGDKGLNQAVWAIRVALDEDSQEPKFIRTVPRVGYQWIYASSTLDDEDDSIPARSSALKAAGIAALAVVIGVVMYISRAPITSGSDRPPESSEQIATKAYLVGQNIHVELASGCLRILRNANNKKLGAPVLSADGTQVAVTMSESKACRLVT